jgi:hypothetical protein
MGWLPRIVYKKAPKDLIQTILEGLFENEGFFVRNYTPDTVFPGKDSF